MINQESWCLCWSQRQNALHVEPLSKHLSLNRECYTEDQGGDFRLLFVGTRDEVSTAADAARSTVREREGNRVRRYL